MVLFNEKNENLGVVRAVRGFNVIRVEPKASDVVWRVEISGLDPYEFDAAGLPGILCPDANIAKQIKASAVYLDGVTVQHQWQAKMWELLKSIKPEQTKVEAQALDAQALLAGDRRTAMALGLYGPLSHVPAILQEQNLDPSHHWFGSIGAWRQAPAQDTPLGRWDGSYRPGYLNTPGAAGVMAWAYGADISGNPYHKNSGLVHRALAASFLHYLSMTEAEEIVEPGLRMAGPNHSRQCHYRYLSDGPAVLFLLQDGLAPEARALWLEAVRRQAERLAYCSDQTTSQWAVTILGHYFAAAVTDESRYRALWRKHLECLLAGGARGDNGQAEAGYFREAGRADGGYNSMSMFYLGCLYRLTHSPELLECLRRAWQLRAHLTLPEPDGQVLSPTNFNSRSGTSFARPFYPDAALLAGAVEQADDALLRGAFEDVTVPWNLRTQTDIDKVVGYWTAHSIGDWNEARVAGSFTIGVLLSTLSAGTLPSARAALPMERRESFVRNFGDEFVCVRRPAYYAVVYTARRRGERQGSKVVQGGGLSALWTPECGTTLFSVNDGPWFNHAVTGQSADGHVVSSSFADPKAKLHSSDPERLSVSAKIPTTPLHYERTYRFDDTSLAVTLTLTAATDWSCQTLYEVIPYLCSERKRLVVLGAKATAGEGATAGSQSAGRICVVCPKGCVNVEFASPVGVAAATGTGKSRDGQARRVLIALPTTWTAGQQQVLRYCIRPSAVPTAQRDSQQE